MNATSVKIAGFSTKGDCILKLVNRDVTESHAQLQAMAAWDEAQEWPKLGRPTGSTL